MNTHSIRPFARRLAVLLAFAAVATACLNTDSPAGVSTGPFFTITSNIADLTSYPAGAVLIVHARVSHDGASIDSANVGWKVVSGGGIVSAEQTSSDTSGVASVAWTLGDTAGENVLVMAIGDVVDTLHVNGVVGEPSYLLAPAGDSTTVAVGGPAILQAKVTDRARNPVPSTAVTWNASRGTVSSTSALTDPGGVASISFQAGSPGTYLITAEVSGVASHTFKVVVQ